MILLGLLLVRLGDVDQVVLDVRLVRRVALDELHLDQVDDALELAGLADRQGADGRDDAQLVLHLLDAGEEVGAHAVQLVDVGDARDVVLVGLEPDRFRLHLDAADGAEDADGAVQDAKERSTSAVKSTWPGVSMRLMRVSPHSMATAALLIVMPFCFSRGRSRWWCCRHQRRRPCAWSR